MIDLGKTIAPKTDQLNADDLITGPMTITVTGVKLLSGDDQPIAISFEGDGGKPYKPGKSMRRVLVYAWGRDGSVYAGRSMTLYRDEAVKFGGADVGGIRISHLSHIKGDFTMALTESKAKRKPFKVKVLQDQRQGGNPGRGRANDDRPEPDSQKQETAASEPRKASTEPWDVWADKMEAERDGFADRAKLIEWWNTSSKTPDWATLKEKNPARAEGLKGGVTKKAAELAAKADEL